MGGDSSCKSRYGNLRFPFFVQLAIRSIRSARDCASCVQLRLGLSDQLEIAPAVHSSLAFLYTARDSVYQISARLCQLCTARCFRVGPADGFPPALCLPAVQGSSDGAVN